MTLLYIGILGLIGVFARYHLGAAVGGLSGAGFPLATFGINVGGSFLIGLVYAAGVERSLLPADLATGLMVGGLGGFTTFSTYCLELSRLIEAGQYFYVALYLSLSTFVGVLATFGGLLLGRQI